MSRTSCAEPSRTSDTRGDQPPLPSECPRCGQRSGVKPLEATPVAAWYSCDTCRHVWRGPGLDAFAYIVCSRAVTVRPVPERHPRGAARAPRFAVDLPLRYRVPGDDDWQDAVTENISRSGVLFRTERPLPPRTAVEMVLEVPNPVPGGPPDDVVCLGDVVRAHSVNGDNAVAVAVGNYRLRAF